MTLHLTGSWKSINSYTYGTRLYKTHQHSSSNNPALPPTWAKSPFYNNCGGTHNFIGKYCPMWGCLTFHPYCTITLVPCTPPIPKTPHTPYFTISVVPSFVHTHIYLCSLTFVLDLVKWPWYGGSKSLSLKMWFIALFQHPGDNILYIHHHCHC